MKIPYKWLIDYVKTDASAEEIAAAVASIGTEVEEIIHPTIAMEKVVVGKITSIEKHPDADKLQVCQLDIGEDALVQIVTGAENVFPGAYVPVALHGAKLPNGLKIKKSKLRGVPSYGMLCSGEELLLTGSAWPGADVDGILILEDVEIGVDMQDLLPQSDVVIDFEVGANRADCLSILGIAREAGAALDVPVKAPVPTFTEAGDDIQDYVKVTVKDTDLCPRYMARAVKNVVIAPSPKWMQERLLAAGMRPISNIVDITNFVMLETGQPLHAFDKEDIHGAHIIVRRAEKGETLTTLDGKEQIFSDSNLLITDETGAIGIAGIMGGENSEIKETTKTVIFEAAKFTYGNIRQTARGLGIASESSMRFSKGIDATTAAYALHRACQLVEMLGAGEIVTGEIDVLHEDLSEKVVCATTEGINKRLGTALSQETMLNCLKRVNIAVEVQENKMFCTIPRYRMDIFGEVDIAEEVARIYGYDNIPEANSKIRLMHFKGENPSATKEQVRDFLSAFGYDECMSYSFMGMEELDRLQIPADDILRKAVSIINPLGEDKAYMRTTLLPAMLNTVRMNTNQKNTKLRLYEISHIYLPKNLPLTDTLPREDEILLMAITKDVGDFYALKNDVAQVVRVLRGKEESYAAVEKPYLYPGIAAEILLEDKVIGEIGEIHPAVAKNYELPEGVIVAMVNLSALRGGKKKTQYEEIPKYPAITRDIAVLVNKAVEAGRMQEDIKKAGGKYLETVTVFDVYVSDRLGKDKKSIAYALTFRSQNETLQDKMIEKDMQHILAVLEQEYEAVLREQ